MSNPESLNDSIPVTSPLRKKSRHAISSPLRITTSRNVHIFIQDAFDLLGLNPRESMEDDHYDENDEEEEYNTTYSEKLFQMATIAATLQTSSASSSSSAVDLVESDDIDISSLFQSSLTVESSILPRISPPVVSRAASGLPTILVRMQQFLKTIPFDLYNRSIDGRINSISDEGIIVTLLMKRGFTIHLPPKRNTRWWWDILVDDEHDPRIQYPVNIKSTVMKNNDDVGNISICAYAYTNTEMVFRKHYDNKMINLFLAKIAARDHNTTGRDYYFLVVNKLYDENQHHEVVLNSILGLSKITPNPNKIPFQINWKHNKVWIPKTVPEAINFHFESLAKMPLSPQEVYRRGIIQMNESLQGKK
jgi:hypothetical protein